MVVIGGDHSSNATCSPQSNDQRHDVSIAAAAGIDMETGIIRLRPVGIHRLGSALRSMVATEATYQIPARSLRAAGLSRQRS